MNLSRRVVPCPLYITCTLFSLPHTSCLIPYPYTYTCQRCQLFVKKTSEKMSEIWAIMSETRYHFRQCCNIMLYMITLWHCLGTDMCSIVVHVVTFLAIASLASIPRLRVILQVLIVCVCVGGNTQRAQRTEASAPLHSCLMRVSDMSVYACMFT